MTVTSLIVALFVVVMASTVQGAVGFGANLVAMPLLVQVDSALVPGPALIATAALNIFVLARDRASIEPRPVTNALVGRVFGTALGVVALGSLSDVGLGYVIAAVVLGAVIVSVSGVSLSRSRRNMLTAGSLSGFGAATAGIGGPPVALLFQDAKGAEVRASMGAYFLVGAAITFTGLGFAGRFGAEEVRLGLVLVPASLVGFLVSGPVSSVLDRGYTRVAILVVSASSAVVLIVRLVAQSY